MSSELDGGPQASLNDPGTPDAASAPGKASSRIDKRGDPEATRARILAAAAAEFAEYGIAGARVDRIAENAKSNKQLIYRYFGTKQDLYESVMDRLVTQARAAIEEDRSSGRSYMASRQFHAGRDDARLIWARLQSWEGLTEGVESPELDAKRAENFRIMREWIEEDQAAGRITNRLSADKLVALVVFGRIIPLAMPRVFRLVLGQPYSDEFEKSWFEFLRVMLTPVPGETSD
ncbi:TetR/AcrR family transcriptional regulator [Nocardia anaemiae]|uniref:TetR/AcrR family transcriptional regulator n=1 Tax=Nocardia anaemiae TaxID=263910 RepID=UPI0009FE31EE|nr:TetR/AcrR family transcriptional regulator [Nocardia anaemiae]